MIDRVNRKECTGCGSCSNICPKQAIQMKPDSKGFLYPITDNNKCIHCGLCVKRCPIYNKVVVKSNYVIPMVYAAWSLDEKIRINSTSGGIFSELAKVVLANNGCVVGAQYNSEHLVEHIMITKLKDLSRLRQSKYVQSDIKSIYKSVEKKLKENRIVLFVGSPCEIAGIKSYLGKDYDNLLLCDFVCRGTNSPKAYKEYLKDLENHYNSEIQKVWFKNKDKGWNLFSTKVIFKNGDEYHEDRNHDAFMLGYIHYNLFMRDSCSFCKYKEFPRISDITLADFWGIGMYRSELDDDKGTSLIMVNSDKGRVLLNSIRKNIYISECPVDWALEGNTCILNVAEKNKFSDDFFKELGLVPFNKLIFKYVKKNKKKSINDLVQIFIKKVKTVAQKINKG